jgi:hypothetical protein
VVKVLASATVMAAVLAGGLAQGATHPGRLDRRVPLPQRDRSVVMTPTKGRVVLYRRGNRKVSTRPVVVRVGNPVVVPLGSVVDTTRGKATITTAISRSGTVTAKGSFAQGVFAVDQDGTDTAISLGGSGPRFCTRPRQLLSHAAGTFIVLAGASASRAGFRGHPSRVPATWVSEDLCSTARTKTRAGHVQTVNLGSRRASLRSAHHQFGAGSSRTTGRHGSATVRGRVVAGH